MTGVVDAGSIPFWGGFRTCQAESSLSIILTSILRLRLCDVKENINLGLRLVQRSSVALMLRSKKVAASRGSITRKNSLQSVLIIPFGSLLSKRVSLLGKFLDSGPDRNGLNNQ
jgi:hypothetical protein